MSLTPEEQAELDALDAELGSEEPAWLAKSKRKQDLARMGVEAEHEAEGSTIGEDIKSAAMGAANMMAPKTSTAGLAATALFNPAALPISATTNLLRSLAGTDEAAEEAEAQSPAGFRAGELGAIGANVISGAPGMAKGLAALPGALKGGAASLGARMASGKDVAKAAGSGFADGAMQGGLTGGVTNALRKGAKAAFPDPVPLTPDMVKRTKTATAGPAPELSADELADMLGKLKGTPAGPVASPPRSPMRDIDPSVRPDMVPKPSAGARTEPAPDLQDVAVQRVTKADVGADVPPAPPYKGPGPTFTNAADDLARYDAEAAEQLAAARRTFQSMPLAPPPGTPLTTAQLRVEARAAVKANESLQALAKRLGLKKTNRELAAVFKAAQIGN
jgi:hypothetical protein